ncbi:MULTISPECIES: endonuclease/exonuclease/phosphatase family protein [unclassified Nonomuraea]|uniref:endonuclease/exonuclease/phosphatase family protein n=1 Tax=unclassified Nonomuraea TaxID=2593643 RepID=UPI0033E49AAE
MSRLKADGWPEGDSFARFATIRETTCNGEPFGIALFSRRQLDTAQKYDLPEDQRGGVHKLLCAPLAARPHLRFCTTHITGSEAVIGGSNIKEQQLAAVRGHLQELHNNGDTVLIAGDFNARPDDVRLNSWYSSSLNVPNNSGNTGAYRELDDQDPVCVGIGETTVNEVNGDGEPIETKPPPATSAPR